MEENPDDFRLHEQVSTNRHTLDTAADSAHRRRANAYREDWEQKPSLISTPTKVMLSLLVVGGLTFGGYRAYEYFTQNPDAVDKLMEQGPLGLAAGETQAPAAGAKPPLTLRGVEVKNGEGIIGETVVSGPYAVEIYDAGTVTKTEAGVAMVALMGAVGNASKEPLNSPNVQVFLLEEDGSRHASSDQRGSYKSGMPLNPKLCLKHAWGFVVPDKTRFTHAVFEFPDKQQAMVNLQERTPENLQAIETQEREEFESYKAALASLEHKAFAVKAAPTDTGVSRETARMRKELDELQAELDASKVKTATLLVEAEALDKQLTRNEKKLKSNADGLKRSRLELEKTTEQLAAAERYLKELQRTEVRGADSRESSRQSVRLDSNIAKAQQNFGRAERHLKDAKEEVAKDEAEKRELEEVIKKDEQRLQQIKSSLDSEALKEKGLQKRVDDASEKLIEMEKKSVRL